MPKSDNNSHTTLSSDLQGSPFCANAYDFPITTAVIRYHHAIAGFPIKETWCKAIAKGNYNTWPGVTVELARKYCPDADETIIDTMSQRRKNIRSTKIKTKEQDANLKSLNKIVKNVATKVIKTNEAHVFIKHSSKLYYDQTGKFPCTARSGNQYLMIIYLVDENVILAETFKNKQV